jgi:diguanylate cyclase (GGDEF)-like protein
MLSAVAHIESMRTGHSVRSESDQRTKHGIESGEGHTERHLLRLVRHRNSETVVRRLIGTAQSEIGLERFVCIYEPKNFQDGLQVVAGGIHHSLHVPKREQFDGLMARMDGPNVAEIHAPAVGGSGDELSCELARGGLRHAVAFPLSPSRRGLIAWADHKPPTEIARRLGFFNDAAAELVENASAFERVEELSHTDSLTGLYNHRYLQKRLAEEINRARRYRRTLGLVMIDVDLLKSVNDQYGHQAGDAVLCQMGKLFRNSVRDNDVIARYGGDEFCVVMPEADQSTCESFMSRIQANLTSMFFELPDENRKVKCTISLGSAVFPLHGDSAERIIFAADMALLQSKERGRSAGRTLQNG